MNPCSLLFLFFFIAVLAIFHRVPGPAGRRAFLGAVNLAFVATFIPNWQSWASLGIFLAASYILLVAARARAPGGLLAISVAALVGGFLYLRKYVFLEMLVPASLLDHGMALIGVSYMLFKFLHMAVDLKQGQDLRLTFSGYVNYQLAFFTLIAGPIQRYGEFQAFWENPAPDAGDLRASLDGWNRIFNGMLKMGVAAAGALYLYDRAAAGFLEPQSTPALAARFAVYFYAYPAYLYFNFSGYTDIVLGCAKLLGLRLPENFDRPYLARNVVDFWSRWHISLTNWIRDYAFMLPYKWIAERSSRPAAAAAGYLLAFASLLLAGVWHGATTNFVVFGALHGAGAVVTQLYGALLKRRLKAPERKSYNRNKWIESGAIVVTFHFVCFSFLFFPADLQMTLERLHLVAARLL